MQTRRKSVVDPAGDEAITGGNSAEATDPIGALAESSLFPNRVRDRQSDTGPATRKQTEAAPVAP